MYVTHLEQCLAHGTCSVRAFLWAKVVLTYCCHFYTFSQDVYHVHRTYCSWATNQLQLNMFIIRSFWASLFYLLALGALVATVRDFYPEPNSFNN